MKHKHKYLDAEACSGTKTKSSKKKLWLLVAVILLLGLLAGLAYGYSQAKAQLARASALKAELRQVGQCLIAQDVDGAQQALDSFDGLILEVQDSLKTPFWRLAEGIPVLGGNVTTAGQAMTLLEETSRELLWPAVEQLRAHPLTREGSSLEQLSQTAQSYMSFLMDRLPEAQHILDQANTLELGLLDRNGTLKEMLTMADWAMQLVQPFSEEVMAPLLELLQRYPVDQWSVKTLTDPDFLDSCCTVLEKAAPILESTLAQLQGEQNPYQATLTAVQQLLDIFKEADAQLLQPLIKQLRAYPISTIKADDGFQAGALASYISFAEAIMPDAERILAQVQALPLDFLHTNEKLSHMLVLANNMTALYHQSEDIIAFAKTFLADGQDRTYLLVAQNSAEIRASGGFPGAMGLIRIRDGVLTVGDFAGVNDVLAVYAPKEGNFTPIEYTLFRQAINICRDACFCPDFERVAEIWALGYEKKNGQSLDGIVSMTPAIIQQIMSPGETLVLSDGTELTSENATRVLQRDLYFRYFTPGADINKTNTVVDALFAQTAKTALNQIISGISPSKVIQYLEVLREGFADRTLMVWMKQEQEQALVQQLGWSGGLNSDPTTPQAGVYFSLTQACKMGWFLEIDTQLGDPVVNGDGSRTYPVTVKLTNTITKEEIKSAGAQYILGGDGSIVGAVHLFAPAGGTIGSFNAGFQVKCYEYQDLELGYLKKVVIAPGKTQTITYEVTTAPGVEAPLTISQTPTLQAYH